MFIGLERQLRGKPLDVRSGVLICLGTHVFIRLGLSHATGNVDQTRVLGQVVTGVGFLGAGVMLTRGHYVVGLTTASVIWVLAAIGATIGFGNYSGAIALTLVDAGGPHHPRSGGSTPGEHASRSAREGQLDRPRHQVIDQAFASAAFLCCFRCCCSWKTPATPRSVSAEPATVQRVIGSLMNIAPRMTAITGFTYP